MDASPIEVIIVSGLSGAGKTVALRALEDAGYFCIDNLPLTLIGPFLSTIKTSDNIRKIGVGIDIREHVFLSGAYLAIRSLKSQYNIRILFLEAEKEVMLRRFKETRRPHPMVPISGEMNLEKAIDEERRLLAVIRDTADFIMDTSNFTPHQLRHRITSTYAVGASTGGMNVTIISFGFKHGAPQDLDLLFDVRFLPNPYFIAELKPLKGTDSAVAEFVLKHDETVEFFAHVTGLLDFLLPHYMKEGRSYLTIGIGCTGGRHRSPAIVEQLAKGLDSKFNLSVNIVHRDIDS
ncbi:MAG: RNase adapter RapZ [Nitrospirae bacterium]|nr:RNase adapter RapZ [Nitrospirota bacterium]